MERHCHENGLPPGGTREADSQKRHMLPSRRTNSLSRHTHPLRWCKDLPILLETRRPQAACAPGADLPPAARSARIDSAAQTHPAPLRESKPVPGKNSELCRRLCAGRVPVVRFLTKRQGDLSRGRHPVPDDTHKIPLSFDLCSIFYFIRSTGMTSLTLRRLMLSISDMEVTLRSASRCPLSGISALSCVPCLQPRSSPLRLPRRHPPQTADAAMAPSPGSAFHQT